MWTFVIRVVLSLLWIRMIYFETGFWTALFALNMFVFSEATNYIERTRQTSEQALNDYFKKFKI